jgi:hypothetical protein
MNLAVLHERPTLCDITLSRNKCIIRPGPRPIIRARSQYIVRLNVLRYWKPCRILFLSAFLVSVKSTIVGRLQSCHLVSVSHILVVSDATSNNRPISANVGEDEIENELAKTSRVVIYACNFQK